MMNSFRSSPYNRALERKRADDVLSGRSASLAPRPEGIGFSRKDIQRTLKPPSHPPAKAAFNMPDRLDGQGDTWQVGQLEQLQLHLPTVIVIDDSEDENEDCNQQTPLAQQGQQQQEDHDVSLNQLDQQELFVEQVEDHYIQQDQQEDQTFPVLQAGEDEETPYVLQSQQNQQEDQPFAALQDGEDDEASHVLQNQQLHQTQEQTRALLELPEVDIPESQRSKTPRGLSCELLPHQRVGLTWLIRQEEDANKKGSILADGMGLGKTIEALALILSRRFDPTYPTCKTTLIVAPLGLLQQWSEEIHNRVTMRHGGKLSSIVFRGFGAKKMTVQRLLQHDIVLCTYGKIVAEYNMHTRGLRNNCKLLSKEAKFYRVILDEAHFIRNKNAQTSKAVCQLQAVHRLCITGTPLMNTVTELYPLIRFLGIKPYDAWEKFSEDVDCPIKRWAPGMEVHAMLRLQTLVRSLVLRRKKNSRLDGKDIIRLKKRIDVVVQVEFGEDQQAFYNALYERQKLKFNKYLKEGTVMKNYWRILIWILRLRQACNHPYLIQNHCIPDACSLDAEGMIHLALQLPAHVRESINAVVQFRCPTCDDPTENVTKNPVIISPCGHFICAECYAKLMEEAALLDADNGDNPDKLNCPNEGCNSSITHDNILMHNFFVDAYRAQGDLELSDEDEEPLDDGTNPVESDFEDDAEGGHFGNVPQNDHSDSSVEEQREGSSGLFVQPFPDEVDPFGGDGPSSDGDNVPWDELPYTMQRSNILRDVTASQDATPTLQRTEKSISCPSLDSYSASGRATGPYTPVQPVAQPCHIPKGHYGNPVNVDDEEEEAAFNAVSRYMSSRPGQSRGKGLKNEMGNDELHAYNIPNYDGPGSPDPMAKRKGKFGDYSNIESKRSRTGRPRSNLDSPNNRQFRNHMRVQSRDRSSSSDYQLNTGDLDGDRQTHAWFPSASQYDSFDLHNDRQPKYGPLQVEEGDIKPNIHGSGTRVQDLLQKPFVSLSDKRRIAVKSRRAMAAYQKRISDEWVASAKTEKVIELLQDIRTKHSGEKTLVFSLWTGFLDMLEPPLREAKFRYTFYTGGMKTDHRTAAVQTFMTNPELEVMLVSLSAGSCGLNLTAANHVILIEPFWNPFTEEQAVDRCHRLGQAKEVTVYRLLAKNTIEDHVMKLQNKKKDLISTALSDEKTDSSVEKLTVGELRNLFGV